MKQWQVLRTIFPEVITENFEFVNYEESAERLDYWLDERGYMSREDYKKGTVREYGFTEERVIQDFPAQAGMSVHENFRRVLTLWYENLRSVLAVPSGRIGRAV